MIVAEIILCMVFTAFLAELLKLVLGCGKRSARESRKAYRRLCIRSGLFFIGEYVYFLSSENGLMSGKVLYDEYGISGLLAEGFMYPPGIFTKMQKRAIIAHNARYR